MNQNFVSEIDLTHPQDNDVQIIAPDFALKKKIGADIDIKAIFSEENINKAENVIQSHAVSFLEWVSHDLKAMEAHYKEAQETLENSPTAIGKLTHLAFVVKSQAGTFGYQLATAVAKSLDDFCTGHFEPLAEHLMVIRKHLDTLSVIFEKKITGDGGELGASLFASLQALIDKYKKTKKP